MKIAVAGDHAGLELKRAIVLDLEKAGHEIRDLGAHDRDPHDDYPDFAARVAEAIRDGEVERGIVVCGSGVGVSVAVNKFPGLRGAACHDTYSASQGVEHDDMNVLCLGQRVIGEALALEVARAFVGARFSGEERHIRRLEKVNEIEKRFLREPESR